MNKTTETETQDQTEMSQGEPYTDSRPPTLERELASVLNRYSAENGSNTPDWILAEFLARNLELFNQTVQARAKWYGRMDKPAQDDADARALTWLRDLHERANPKPEMLSNTTGTKWAIVPREWVVLGEMTQVERHARQTLAELGVLDPSTELLRAQLMRDHAANARDLARRIQGAAKADEVEPIEAFEDAEDQAAEYVTRLLRETPMGATAEKSSPGLLQSMARDAATEVGPSTDVHVESKQPDHSSRYVQYLLRVPEGSSGSNYQDGIAVVTAVYANGKKHTFPRPILVSNGASLSDSRKPFHYRQLVEALVAAGLRTNDVIGE